MEKQEIIRQPYSLTTARYKSNIHVERVINVIIKSLQPNMVYKNSLSQSNTIFDNRVILIKTNELLPQGSKNYQYVKSALKWLKMHEVYIKGFDKDGKYELFTGLILQFKYYSNNEYVKLEMSNEVLKYLLNNKNGFTRYNFAIAFNSSSSYTSRMYKLIAHWADKKVQNISVEYLRKILVLGEKYNRAVSIKKAILDPAAKELKAKADVWFQIEEPIKESRKVVGWKITIHKREEEEPKSQQSPKEKQVALLPQGTPQESEISVDPEKLQKVKTLFHQKLVDPTNPNSKFKKLKNHAKTID